MTVTTPDITTTLTNATGGLSAGVWGGHAMALADKPPVASDFASLIQGAAKGATVEQREQQIREAANEFVGMAFILPLMKMSRNDPFKSEMFHGGQGEEAFGAQLDEMRAKQVSPAISKPLVDAIYNRFKAQIKGQAAMRQGVDRHG